MEQFEKWWDIFVNKHCETCMKNDWVKDRDTARKHIEKYKHYYRRGYKAALEWIYYEGVLNNSLAGDLIKKELERDL